MILIIDFQHVRLITTSIMLCRNEVLSKIFGEALGRIKIVSTFAPALEDNVIRIEV